MTSMVTVTATAVLAAALATATVLGKNHGNSRSGLRGAGFPMRRLVPRFFWERGTELRSLRSSVPGTAESESPRDLTARIDGSGPPALTSEKTESQ